jgi:hypothetical protein
VVQSTDRQADLTRARASHEPVRLRTLTHRVRACMHSRRNTSSERPSAWSPTHLGEDGPFSGGSVPESWVSSHGYAEWAKSVPQIGTSARTRPQGTAGARVNGGKADAAGEERKAAVSGVRDVLRALAPASRGRGHAGCEDVSSVPAFLYGRSHAAAAVTEFPPGSDARPFSCVRLRSHL